MSIVSRRPLSSLIPDYDNNAVLKLIIYTGVGFTIFQLIRVIMLMVGFTDADFFSKIGVNIGIAPLAQFKLRMWTLLTYGWAGMSFWNIVSNMIWLFCFGSLVQMLVGNKQIIPLYIYSLVIGGLFYLLSQYIPKPQFTVAPFIFDRLPRINVLVGAQAGLMGLAVAAITLTPKYRFYLTPTFTVPISVVIGIFGVLMLLFSRLEAPLLLLLVGGGLTGFAYICLLQKGYKPGAWMYNLYGSIENMVTPKESTVNKRNQRRKEVLKNLQEQRYNNTQKRIDELLDKINQKGYKSLSNEEKDFLMRAGKEK